MAFAGNPGRQRALAGLHDGTVLRTSLEALHHIVVLCRKYSTAAPSDKLSIRSDIHKIRRYFRLITDNNYNAQVAIAENGVGGHPGMCNGMEVPLPYKAMDGSLLGTKQDAIKLLAKWHKEDAQIEQMLKESDPKKKKASDNKLKWDMEAAMIRDEDATGIREYFDITIDDIQKVVAVQTVDKHQLNLDELGISARSHSFGDYLSDDYDMDRVESSQTYLDPYNEYNGYSASQEIFGTNSDDLSTVYIGLMLLFNVILIILIICLCGCLIICGVKWLNQYRYSSKEAWSQEEDERV